MITATVWNWGPYTPIAQMSDQTGFVMQGDTASESAVNTDTTWEVQKAEGRGFLPIKFADVPSYYAASPGEMLDGATYDWGWQASSAGWAPAITVGTGEPGRYPNANPVGTGSGNNRWLLVPDPLPQMEYSETPMGKVVRIEGPARGDDDDSPLRRRATQKGASILVDRGTMTTGYPELVFGRGKAAVIRLTYSEALFDAKGKKANRNVTEGRSTIAHRAQRYHRRRRRRRPEMVPPLVARMAVPPDRRGDRGRGARRQLAQGKVHRLPLQGAGRVRGERPRPSPDVGRRDEDRADERPRDLLRLPLLGAAPVHRRHAHPGPHLLR